MPQRRFLGITRNSWKWLGVAERDAYASPGKHQGKYFGNTRDSLELLGINGNSKEMQGIRWNYYRNNMKFLITEEIFGNDYGKYYENTKELLGKHYVKYYGNTTEVLRKE